MPSAVFKLSPGIQSYAWGKKGSASLAAQLAQVSVEGFGIDEDKTYAELWMGTHPNLPSKLLSTPTTLSSHLQSHQSLIGSKIPTAFPDSKDGSLPFLFKVLSIGTALSIQAHPSKELAKRLFEEKPDIYKDPNHKPEMAIALTPFLAFLNFLPLPTLLLHLLSVPELDPLIPSSLTSELAISLTLPETRPADPFLFTPTVSPPSSAQKAILKKIFHALMSADTALIQNSIQLLIARYEKGEEIGENEKDLVGLTKMLNEQYPNDVGVLCVFFLNVVELKRGEAAFLGADMPHAYISGDIIECMATSDNVVRAGLTPKLRDVPTLVDMLTYEAGPGSKQLLQPVAFDATSSTLLYDPPIAEFSVLRVELDTKSTAEAHRAVDGPSLCVITKGQAILGHTGEEGEQKLKVAKGDVVFIGAGQPVTWTVKEEQSLQVFRTFVEA